MGNIISLKIHAGKLFFYIYFGHLFFYNMVKNQTNYYLFVHFTLTE